MAEREREISRYGNGRSGLSKPGAWRGRAACMAAMAPLLLAGCLEPSAPATGEGREHRLSMALATVPASFTDVQVASGLVNPTQMAFAPDGRLFVNEQGGRIRIIKNGTLLSAPFATLSVSSAGERGVLGIGFDPDFSSNGFVYAYYTSIAGPHNRVSRFRADGDIAAGGETVLFELPTLGSATNHNGGAIHFGPDGKLYIATGENARPSLSQSLESTLGKMLRINADGSIPADNPFYGSAAGDNRAIWALGLRNPFTFAFQPGTGRMFINDVGESLREEIDEGAKGANYGWPATEGPTSDSRFKSPFHSYTHASACGITGGVFYNPSGAGFPAEYIGDYFFTDYCGGWIRRIDLATKAVTGFADGIGSPVDLKVGPDGALYYLSRGNGSLRKIAYAGASQGPRISRHPASVTVSAGAAVGFAVEASGAAPIRYQWQRDRVDIAGATAAAYSLAVAAPSDHGAIFRCIVSDSFGSAVSEEAILTVTTNRAPTALIAVPSAGSLFRGGGTLAFGGQGTDPEDGALPASAMTWEVRLWHDDGNGHSHPAYGPVGGIASGSFAVPVQGETSSNIWYRIHLTVRDSQGMSAADSMDVRPEKADVTLATDPAGLEIKLDGKTATAPLSFTGVVGIQRAVEAVTPQVYGGKTWEFASWSGGGAAAHVLSTPEAAETFTAVFREAAAVRIFEAENAKLYGVAIATEHKGHTGTGFADYLHASGDYIEWTVEAAGGSASLEFRYALGSPSARSLSITVNGAVVGGNLSFAPTASWTDWKAATLAATLASGTNKVRLTAIGSSGPNLDNLSIR